jgi:hypothetical protein
VVVVVDWMRLELKIYPISCCTYLVRFGMDWIGVFYGLYKVRVHFEYTHLDY